MKTFVIWAAATVIAAAAGFHGSCLAGEKAMPGPRNIIAELGAAVPTAELNKQHARGSTNIDVKNTTLQTEDGAFNNGALRGNSVIGSSATGTITATNSVNNNTGFTTVFQNSGNNSMFQQSTSINITLH
jgi:hypothetical protein